MMVVFRGRVRPFLALVLVLALREDLWRPQTAFRRQVSDVSHHVPHPIVYEDALSGKLGWYEAFSWEERYRRRKRTFHRDRMSPDEAGSKHEAHAMPGETGREPKR
jgi:hypothetical protein